MKRINFSDKWIKIAVHSVLWLMIFVLPLVLYKSNPKPPHDITDDEKTGFIYLNLSTNFLWVAAFYLNAFVLTPLLLNKKKILFYIIAIALCFTIIIGIHWGFFYIFVSTIDFNLSNSTRFNIAPYLLTLAAGTIWQMWSDKVKAEQLSVQKQQENLKSELSFLRSQISPHFVFNILNNIVALVRLKSDELEPTVMKLSGLMQYMLYETDEEKVMLKTEAEYLESYISLQQQRFGKKVQVNTHISIENGAKEIEPMLLIPFVENAFKHGVGMIDNPQINIRLEANETQLHFYVSNKYNPHKIEVKDKTSGIGLLNVQRRLNLLYNDNQKLIITKSGHSFEISLTINWH